MTQLISIRHTFLPVPGVPFSFSFQVKHSWAGCPTKVGSKFVGLDVNLTGSAVAFSGLFEEGIDLKQFRVRRL